MVSLVYIVSFGFSFDFLFFGSKVRELILEKNAKGMFSEWMFDLLFILSYLTVCSIKNLQEKRIFTFIRYFTYHLSFIILYCFDCNYF